MPERTDIVTFQGNPLTLIGDEVKVGDKLPDCQLVGNDLSPIQMSSFEGKICVISCVPSLDTPVCDLQTKRFNEEAGKLGEDVAVITVSMDLPFAQQRWSLTRVGLGLQHHVRQDCQSPRLVSQNERVNYQVPAAILLLGYTLPAPAFANPAPTTVSIA